MDVNGDGNIDLLSGCYSDYEPMAGLLYVLAGSSERTFGRATALNGTDNRPLILPAGAGQDDVIDKICTRPFACDLDGDGKLDLVVGNFRGTFGFFKGEGGGKFGPKATWLEAGGIRMAVDAHGDPFLVDWDGDTDLDLLSGSAQGGVFLFENIGSKTAPKFAARVTLVEPVGHGSGEALFGDAHVKAPASDTRVWAADVDGDRKLDLLVGDTITLYFNAKGVDEATAREKDEAWRKKQQAHMEAYPRDNDDEAAQEKWQEGYAKLDKEREAFVKEEMTGFVWLFLRK